MEEEFDISKKPDPAVCPRRFCFMWRIGRVITSQSPEPPTVPQGCGNGFFGVCTRLDPVNGDHDWYEAHEPNLEEAGLPWFYFVPSPEKLVPDFQEKYIAESEALWGKDHWQENSPKSD